VDIFEAISRADAGAVSTLLTGDRKLAGARDSRDRRPLHAAAERGDTGLIQLLLADGAARARAGAEPAGFRKGVRLLARVDRPPE
jgi:hypothetical protein